MNIPPQSSMALLRCKMGLIYIVVGDYYKITIFIGLVLIMPELRDNDCGCSWRGNSTAPGVCGVTARWLCYEPPQTCLWVTHHSHQADPPQGAVMVQLTPGALALFLSNNVTPFSMCLLNPISLFPLQAGQRVCQIMKGFGVKRNFLSVHVHFQPIFLYWLMLL